MQGTSEEGKGRQIHISYFAQEEEAARAFDRVNIAKLGHAKAETNFPLADYRADWARLEALGLEGAVAQEREQAAARRGPGARKMPKFKLRAAGKAPGKPKAKSPPQGARRAVRQAPGRRQAEGQDAAPRPGAGPAGREAEGQVLGPGPQEGGVLGAVQRLVAGAARGARPPAVGRRGRRLVGATRRPHLGRRQAHGAGDQEARQVPAHQGRDRQVLPRLPRRPEEGPGGAVA